MVVYQTQDSRAKQNDLREKNNYNFTMWFNKKKLNFSRFPSFRFNPIPEIENLETSESFRLHQKLIVPIASSVGKLKIFIEFQILDLMFI